MRIKPENFTKAIEHARRESNRVRALGSGRYTVACPRGHQHEVVATDSVITCDCDAGRIDRHACHHMGAVLLYRGDGVTLRARSTSRGPKTIVCAPGTFERCARLQDAVNAVNRSLGLREVVYVERADGAALPSAERAAEPIAA